MAYLPSVTLRCLKPGCTFEEQVSNMKVADMEIEGHCKMTSGAHAKYLVILGSNLETFTISLSEQRIAEIIGPLPNKESSISPHF
ncbi:hypothetical protein A2960_06535 [Candidatus Gottesmanbacteria bacterium RIFCSPLOWO2_01_FULL_39_12b]|uniref:Uncharacterized protein n=1 Tax=Candidatus Gottesmanbacteria bacterium RIFCSPLOWO2_01_FULL_39_12b TaxID=1798388 RepID=A0A1F6ARW7_9BACT|nr:MAG: hypothetical protein A2960_06535 [Candidatus Gottesmanbacteria bacterium RIFCSPLOWO2_01_FULL_39_12b]